jgi:hypothetical protein
MTLTNYNKVFDENIAALWEGLFIGLNAELFQAACLKVIAINKFWPNASEIIDAYQQIKTDIEHERYEKLKETQRLLVSRQSYCYLCDNSGRCYVMVDGYERMARCICTHGQDLNEFVEANIKRDYKPELKDHYNERDKTAIRRGRNPFYFPTIQEALGDDDFAIYDARRKEKYLSRNSLSNKDITEIIGKLHMLGHPRKEVSDCQITLGT